MSWVRARPLVAGSASGPVLWLDEPVSFWGGVDPDDGRIVDSRHPQANVSVTSTILCLPHGRGSSSSPSVLAEMIRRGTAPAAILLGEADPMLVLGSLVASELYGVTVPVAVVSDRRLQGAETAAMGPNGNVKFR